MTAGRGPRSDRQHDSPVRHIPADLAAVVALVVLATLAVFVAVLLPGAGDGPPSEPADETASSVDTTTETRRGIDGIERAALSVGLSIPVVALLGLGLSLTPLGVALVQTKSRRVPPLPRVAARQSIAGKRLPRRPAVDEREPVLILPH
jgi:hypothetical protein